MNRQRLFFHLGNACIAISLLGFIYTFLPIIQAYLFPPSPPVAEARKSDFYISIPKISAYSEVIPQVDPWDEAAYQEALKKGVAHAAGTKLPGEKGTIFLFAHSSGMPWEVTRENTLFLRLGELNTGDTINISYNNRLYTYTVYDKKEVWPEEIQYLEDTTKNHLILQTCTPIGTTLKRLLIFAKPTN